MFLRQHFAQFRAHFVNRALQFADVFLHHRFGHAVFRFVQHGVKAAAHQTRHAPCQRFAHNLLLDGLNIEMKKQPARFNALFGLPCLLHNRRQFQRVVQML